MKNIKENKSEIQLKMNELQKMKINEFGRPTFSSGT